MKRAELQSKLAAALENRSLVRIVRKVAPAAVDGYVVDTGEHWLIKWLTSSGPSLDVNRSSSDADIVGRGCLEAEGAAAAYDTVERATAVER